jgi:hypothetical protein
MQGHESLVKIAVRCGNYLHFLYDDEGPSFSRFPRDKLIHYSKTAREALENFNPHVFTIPVDIENTGGSLYGFFHVLDLIQTADDEIVFTSETYPEQIITEDLSFTAILQIYHAVNVLGLENGLQQPQLHQTLMDMAFDTRKHVVFAEDLKLLWTSFRHTDQALLVAGICNIVVSIDNRALRTRDMDALVDLLEAETGFKSEFERFCGRRDKVKDPAAAKEAVQKRLDNYRQDSAYDEVPEEDSVSWDDSGSSSDSIGSRHDSVLDADI